MNIAYRSVVSAILFLMLVSTSFSAQTAGVVAAALREKIDQIAREELAQTGVPVVDRKNGLSLPRINLRAALDAVR